MRRSGAVTDDSESLHHFQRRYGPCSPFERIQPDLERSETLHHPQEVEHERRVGDTRYTALEAAISGASQRHWQNAPVLDDLFSFFWVLQLERICVEYSTALKARHYCEGA